MHMPGMESGFTGNSSWAVGDMVNGRDAVVGGAAEAPWQLMEDFLLGVQLT